MFDKNILYQTIATIIILLSMFLMYTGGCYNNVPLSVTGMIIAITASISPTLMFIMKSK